MKKFTTCDTPDKKKRHILHMIPVLTVAGALSIALTGCGTSSEDEVQRYSWPPPARKTLLHRSLQKSLPRKSQI